MTNRITLILFTTLFSICSESVFANNKQPVKPEEKEGALYVGVGGGIAPFAGFTLGARTAEEFAFEVEAGFGSLDANDLSNLGSQSYYSLRTRLPIFKPTEKFTLLGEIGFTTHNRSIDSSSYEYGEYSCDGCYRSSVGSLDVTKRGIELGLGATWRPSSFPKFLSMNFTLAGALFPLSTTVSKTTYSNDDEDSYDNSYEKSSAEESLNSDQEKYSGDKSTELPRLLSVGFVFSI